MTASGGSTAARSAPPRACRRGLDRHSRRRAGSSAAPAGSAARRRRRGPDVRAHAGTGARLAAMGSARTRVAPDGSISAQTRASFTSANPRAIASPRPAPRRGRVAAPEGLEHGLADRPPRRPVPRRRRGRRSSLPARSTRTRTGEPAGENFSAFSIRFTSTRSIWARRPDRRRVGQSSSDRAPRAAEPVERRPTRSSPCHSSGCGAAAPASRRDRSSRLPTSRSSRPASARIVSRARAILGRAVRIREPRPPREDRRQRRAQVVRDGAEERGLERVAAAKRLRLEGGRRAVGRGRRPDREQRRERRQEPVRGRPGRVHARSR